MGVLPSTKYRNNERTISGNVIVENSDALINVDTSLVACTINLQEIPSDYWSTLYKLYIKDLSGNCFSNNITIVAPTGFKINNQQSIVLNQNSISAYIVISSNVDYCASFISPSITDVPIIVNNTVYVMKNGHDSTGLVERFDKPFLTISAARSAALTYFTSRTQSNRILIVVETGTYAETIIIDDFIDYNLNNSTITGGSNNHCLTDNGNTYTLTTNGQFTSIITGTAKFVKNSGNYGGIVISSLNSSNLKLCVNLDLIYTSTYECLLLFIGFVKLTANKLYNSIDTSIINSTVNIVSDLTYSSLPSAEIWDCQIYTNQNGSINPCIEFSNANPTLNPNYGKLMLINCEVGCWSTQRPAINCDRNGTGIGQLTLKNTLIYSQNTASISDDAPAPNADIIKVYCYNSYSNKSAVFTNVNSGYVVGSLTVDAAIIFNQGNTI